VAVGPNRNFKLMGLILALDIGGKRTGMAISDENHIFAFPLQTVESHNIIKEIDLLLKERNLESIVLGLPKNLKNENTDGTKKADDVFKKLKKKYPLLKIFQIDERFTSSMARKAMVEGGMKKKDREIKENTDKLSATLILQSFLEQKSRFGFPQNH
jgi:putative Holliday junction resolvase